MSPSTKERIPEYLWAYVVEQNYDKYTPREQATWRFIMRQSKEYFSRHAHSVYLDGLEQTGIPLERIPDIDEMDEKLSRYGWGAVCVRGFIPSMAFLDFLARKILPIASDMRTLEHVHYTPAPDIVHEAAGHAPIIADAKYREYLIKYANMARKAIYSDEDVRLYEAVRLLSDLKENPDATQKEIDSAEVGLKNASEAITWVSESSKITRMSWWTIEYGLLAESTDWNKDSLKIYGAGLLSSVGEAVSVYDESTKKLPLTLDCVHQAFDITEPQPQVYVASSIDQMISVLGELEDEMAYKKGGLEGLALAKKAKTVTTLVCDNGLGVSGIVERYDWDRENECPAFVKWSEKCQLSLEGVELEGQGVKRHPHGFSSPMGPWKNCDKPELIKEDELEKLGIIKGNSCEISFQSGIIVTGKIEDIFFADGTLKLITWKEAHVTWKDEVLFQPEWGDFDMLVGAVVSSVYGGPADWNKFGDYDIGRASTLPGRQSPFSEDELELFRMYDWISSARSGKPLMDPVSEISNFVAKARTKFPNEWLLYLEAVELLSSKYSGLEGAEDLQNTLSRECLDLDRFDGDTREMVRRGLELCH